MCSPRTAPTTDTSTTSPGLGRRDAGITGLRVHDLRHHYASVLASSGYSLPVIGQLLGHTQAATTQRYAHLFDDVLRGRLRKGRSNHHRQVSDKNLLRWCSGGLI